MVSAGIERTLCSKSPAQSAREGMFVVERAHVFVANPVGKSVRSLHAAYG
jgi:hypothetical protein